MEVSTFIEQHKAKMKKVKVFFILAQVVVLSFIALQAHFDHRYGALISLGVHLLLTLYTVYLWRKVNRSIDNEYVKSIIDA